MDFEFKCVQDFTERSAEEISAIGTGIDRVSVARRHISSNDGNEETHGFANSQCPRCKYPALIVYKSTRKDHLAIKSMTLDEDVGILLGGTSQLTVLAHYPASKTINQDPLWPDGIRRKFADAQKMLAQDISPSIILTTCGTLLELALKELDPKDSSSSLYKRIEKLHGVGVITSPIKDWAHDLRVDRNDAVHDGEGDKDSAAEYVEFLKMFFSMVFSLPKRIDEKRSVANSGKAQF